MIPGRRMRQRAVEPIFCAFEHGRGRPEQWVRLQRGVDRRREVSGEETRLQLASPIAVSANAKLGLLAKRCSVSAR